MSEKLIPSDKLILFCGSFIPIAFVFAVIGDSAGDTATTIGLYCFFFGIISPLIVMACRGIINKTFDPSIKKAEEEEERKRRLEEEARKARVAKRRLAEQFEARDRIRAEEDEARKRKLAEQEKKARAAKRRLAEQEKKARAARELKDSLKCLEMSTYDLARIVQSVVDEKDFEEDKKILSVFKKNKKLLNDGMNDLCGSFYDDFEHSIKFFMDSVGYKINYRYDAVKEKLDSLVHRCIDCSKDLVAEKLGLEISNSNSADSTPIRKTRKWE